MKGTFFSIVLLLSTLIISCSEEPDVELSPPKAEVEETYSVDLEIDVLSDLYGPALTRSLGYFEENTEFAYPLGIKDITLSPSDKELPANGEVREVKVTGLFLKLEYRAYDATNDRIIDQVTVTPGSRPTVGTAYLTIDTYEIIEDEQDAVRVILFEYQHPVSKQWVPHDYAVQEAVISTAFRTWSNIREDIPKKGSQYIVSISGEFPTNDYEFVLFRAWDATHDELVSSAVIMGAKVKSVFLDIFENPTSEAREIKLQYAHSSDINDWIDFEDHIQLGTTFTVAVDAPEMIPETGGTYTVLFEGEWSGRAFIVGVYNVDGSVAGSVALFTKCPGSVDLTVDPNTTGKVRTVQFKYVDEQIGSTEIKWVVFHESLQETHKGIE